MTLTGAKLFQIYISLMDSTKKEQFKDNPDNQIQIHHTSKSYEQEEKLVLACFSYCQEALTIKPTWIQNWTCTYIVAGKLWQKGE